MRTKKFEAFITEDSTVLFNNMFRSILESERLTNSEKEIISQCLPLNEGFISDFKSALVKAKNTAEEKTKQVIDKVLDWASSGVEMVKNIIKYLKEKISEIFTKVSSMKDELLKYEKFVQKVKATKIDELKEELVVLKDVATFYSTRFIDKLMSKLSEVLTNIIGKSDAVVEGHLFADLGRIVESEKVSFKNVIKSIPKTVDMIVHKIESVPPFTYLHNIQHYAEKGINYLVEQLSFLTKLLGGPEFVIPVMAGLLAIGIEVGVKTSVKHAILGPGLLFPPAATVIYAIGNIATFLAVYAAVNTIIGKTSEHH